MEMFFVLGRNPQLSYAEVVSYLIAREINYKVILFENNLLLLSFDANIDLDAQEFGGILGIGKIVYSGKELNKFLKDYFICERKFSYSVLGNYIEETEEILSKKFREEKLKAQVRHSQSRLKIQGGEEMGLSKADVEFFSYKIKGIYYFGKVDQEYSYGEVKKRDMKKPFRRESLAISPRLSKILINLSQTKKGEILLDPFCGIGGILQEALLKGIDCIGIDKDRDAIEGAKKNLKWFSENYKFDARYKLFNMDSAQMPRIKIDGVASEPALGELTKSRLNDNEARRFIENFEKLIVPILQSIKQNKNYDAKIAITMPFVRDFLVNVGKVCQQTGLKIYDLPEIKMPIKEFREKQFIGREIIVLE